TFRNGFTSPRSKSFADKLGNCWHNSSSAALTLVPPASTTVLPCVCSRSGVGILILIAMGSSNELWFAHERLECLERRLDRDGFFEFAGDGFLRLQAVAGDAENDLLVARQLALLDQLASDRDGHAGGGLAEDTFGAAQQGHPLGDFRIGRVVSP